MTKARYLPASRVKAGSLRLGRLSVHDSDGRELGKLKGFIVEAGELAISGLVVEAADAEELEVPMGPLQVDALSRSLRLISGPTGDAMVPFSADRVRMIDDADLWVPLFTTAA
ncbi:MAG TPA: hypothetical protein VFJ02_20885 [Vicinamibacterales bacterium]|nr:hypothetical protein [Vicinamibacterales bacterium]